MAPYRPGRAAEYCTLIGGGAGDADSDSDASPLSAKPARGFPCDVPGGERPYACDAPGCEYKAIQASHLKMHKRTHEKPYACDEPGCVYKAAKMKGLAMHKRTHSGERPFLQLAEHKRTHSSERPYACDAPGCEYKAIQASHLKVHKRTHSGERPYACDEAGCKYMTTTASHIKVHKCTHSGDRPYACDEPGCKYKAIQSSHLAAHKRNGAQAHARRRAADLVRRGGLQDRAAESSHLAMHKRTHSDQRPYTRAMRPGARTRLLRRGGLLITLCLLTVARTVTTGPRAACAHRPLRLGQHGAKPRARLAMASSERAFEARALVAAIQASPGEGKAWMKLATLARRERDLGAAERVLLAAVKTQPKNELLLQ
ncbi:hypothetical protein T492DRAFT_907535, partial [Pavlovales sp. CCMP2436]